MKTTEHIRVTRVVDSHDDYLVEVDLRPLAHQILDDLLRAMKATSPHLPPSLVTAAHLSGPARHKRIAELLTAIEPRKALQVHITPAEALGLSFDLTEAAEAPPACSCGRYLLDESDRRDPCGACDFHLFAIGA